jgi:hypothetical protein
VDAKSWLASPGQESVVVTRLAADAMHCHECATIAPSMAAVLAQARSGRGRAADA